MQSYLDHAATTPMRPRARDVLVRELERLGNASATHRAGQLAKRRLEDAREELAAALGAEPSQVVFTSGGSEADSIALLGGRAARPERNRVVISAIEHPAVAEMRRHGAQVLPVGADGIVMPEAWAELDHQVAVVSVMAVNNETGVIQPLDLLVAEATRVGAWSHSDAVQALGHVSLDFNAIGLDLMSVSGHKAGGPVGIGALVFRRGRAPRSIGLGGGQEAEVRSGTAPVALAASFASAAAEAVESLWTESARLTRYRDRIRELVVTLGGRVNGLNCAPHIVNATFPGLRAADLLFVLDSCGVLASAGSACRAGVHQPSQVLLAMGASEAEASASVRFSLGHTTTQAEVDHLTQVLPRAVEQARAAR